MEIKIESADQFDSLINALSGDIVDAEIFFKLHSDLLNSIPDYKEVFNEANTFWSITVRALLDATLLRLCRIYDKHPKSLKVRNLLDTINSHLDIFDIENFKSRLQDNPFVESLAQTARKPDVNTLNRDIASVAASDTLVNKLIIWRNNIIVHKYALNILKKRDITKDYPITRDDISKLLNIATSILNRYCGLFRASTYSTQIVGHDDYLYILKAMKEKIAKYRNNNY